jgi:hypothetical protein
MFSCPHFKRAGGCADRAKREKRPQIKGAKPER